MVSWCVSDGPEPARSSSAKWGLGAPNGAAPLRRASRWALSLGWCWNGAIECSPLLEPISGFGDGLQVLLHLCIVNLPCLALSSVLAQREYADGHCEATGRQFDGLCQGQTVANFPSLIVGSSPSSQKIPRRKAMKGSAIIWPLPKQMEAPRVGV
jgi:hypothetical protein